MCILATNLANEIDEAMYRRISLAVEFKKPDHILRERIWQTLQPENLLLDDDVNFKELARKYELSGGFIKNVWLSAVALMVSRDADKVSQADLERAAGEQVIGGLSNEDFDRQVIPSCGIESVIASDQVTESLRTIVDHRKAQAVLFSQWGFEKIHKNQSGVSVLFAGPPGTGYDDALMFLLAVYLGSELTKSCTVFFNKSFCLSFRTERPWLPKPLGSILGVR